MTRQQAIDELLKKITHAHGQMTTAEQIIAIGRLYDRAFADGVVYGARKHADAAAMLEAAMVPGKMVARRVV